MNFRRIKGDLAEDLEDDITNMSSKSFHIARQTIEGRKGCPLLCIRTSVLFYTNLYNIVKFVAGANNILS